jgi:type VI secretion system secreted protein VgrG
MGVVIESMQGLTIKTGGNSVVIDPSGVTVTGAMVTIDSAMVKIASGPGSPAGAGNALSVVAPMAAALAAEADTAKPGEVLKPLAPTTTPHNPSKAKKRKKSWIEIELVGEDGSPIPGEAYKITLPDGTVAEGTLDDKGLARVDGIDPGNCQIAFPNLDQDAWVKI